MSNHSTQKLKASELAQFTGSEQWHRHAINREMLFTDGAKYVADQAGAYWLLDEIAIIQPYDARFAAEELQVWTLIVNADRSAKLTCDDGNGRVIFSKEIPNTDFPAEGIKLYYTNRTILLPREY